MKARIFSLLLVLALLVTVSVFAVEAETYTVAKTAAELQAMHPTCPHCGATVTWDRFDGRSSEGGGVITGTKHWYFDNLFDTDAEAPWINDVKSGAKICIYFLDVEGGSGYSNPSTGANAYAFKVEPGAQMALMGKGLVAGGGHGTDTCGGAIRLMDGTSAAAPGGKLAIYHDVTVEQTTKSSSAKVSEGGAVYVGQYGSLTMSGGTIIGKKVVSGTSYLGLSSGYNGGAVALAANSTMTMTGGKIIGASAAGGTRGGAIAMTVGAELNLGAEDLPADSVQILGGGQPFTNGGLIFNGGGTINMYDGVTLSGGISNAGTNNSTGGGAIYNTSTFNMYGGIIKDSTCTNYGGIINTSATVRMEGGKISGGEAIHGGNVLVRGGTFTMTGGTIEDGYSNPVADEGDTIKTETVDSNLPLTGGGNVAIIGGTFVLAQAEGKTAEIKNGKADTDGGNVCVVKGTFQLDKGTVSGGQAYYVNGYGLQGGGNIFASGATAIVDINGGVVEGGQAIRGGNVAIFSGAQFTVDGDAQLNVTTPMANVAWLGANLFVRGSNLNLTGGTFNGAADTTNIEGGDYGGNLYIHSCTVTLAGTTITGGKANSGGNIYLHDNASSKLILESGTVTLGNAKSEGGNIYVPSLPTVEITGGYLTAGNANQGGGIQNQGTVKVSGGEISGNVANQNGGNIRLLGGSLEITGGLISAGEAGVYGGNIVLQGGTATFTNGTIQNGKAWKGGNFFIYNGTATMNQAEGATTQLLGGSATEHGGSVYVMAGKTFTMNGGTISGGMVDIYGGNVYNAGTFEMNGGTITAGTNTEGKTVDGGNVYTSGTFTMDGGSITAGVGEYGANVEVVGGTFTMNAGTISGGTATMEGGNVYVYAGEFIMNAGTTITGGTATTDGGNVLVYGGKFTMNDGTITAGKVEAAENGYVSGGNVSVEGGTFTMKAGSITNGAQNVSSSRGGGNVAVVKGTFTMEGGVISGGTTTGHGFGANLYVGFDDSSAKNNAPTVNLLGGEIVGNKTTGGNVLIEAGTLDLDGATVKDGKAVGVGGNIRVLGGTLNIKSGTVSGGTSNAEGGNLAIAGGTINLSGGTVTGGVTPNYGGNVVITGGKINMTGGTITEGSTTREEKADGIKDMTGGGNIFMNGGTFNLNGENAKIIDGTTHVSGGNIFVTKGTFTMTKGTVADGTATYELGNGLQGGGNIYVNGTGKANINGGVVENGYAKRGGNIAVSGSTTAEATIANDAQIIACDDVKEGFMGANLFCRQGTININGGFIDGGNNTLYVAGRNLYAHSGTLNFNGGKMVNGMRNGSNVYLAVTAGYSTQVNLAGTAQVGQIAVESGKAAPIVIKEGFTGTVHVRWLTGAVHNAVDYGTVLPETITAEAAYANTGSVFMGSPKYNYAAYLPVAYGDINGDGVKELYVTKLTKLIDGETMIDTGAEEGTSDIDKFVGIHDVSELNGAALRLAGNNAEITVTDDVSIDANGKSATVNAPAGKTVTLIDTANDDFKTAPGAVTVTGGAKVETDVKTEDGKRYIVVESTITPGTYSAHRISARLHKVSIRPRNVGVYYSVEIKCDSTLEKLVVNYGVAMSIKSMPDDTFLDVENGRDDIRYTYISVTDKSFQSGEYHGALLDGIMGATDKDGNIITDEANAARARLPVYANAYVLIHQDNGTDTMIMADEVNQGKGREDAGFDPDTAIDWTLTEIMEVVNNTTFNKETTTDQARASVQKFYNDWKTIANWNFATIENWVKEGE